jgi:hypothetical protein
MDFASQAHRDKLNFGIKTPTIYYPLLVTISETAYTNQSRIAHYGSRCEPGNREFPWIGILRGVML